MVNYRDRQYMLRIMMRSKFYLAVCTTGLAAVFLMTGYSEESGKTTKNLIGIEVKTSAEKRTTATEQQAGMTVVHCRKSIRSDEEFEVDFRKTKALPAAVKPHGKSLLKLVQIEQEQALRYNPLDQKSWNSGINIEVSQNVKHSRYLMFHYKLGTPKQAGGRIKFNISLNINGIQSKWNKKTKTGVINKSLAADSEGWMSARFDLDKIVQHWKKQTGHTGKMELTSLLLKPGVGRKNSELYRGGIYFRDIKIGNTPQTVTIETKQNHIVRGTKIVVDPQISGELFFTGWSAPTLHLKDTQRLVRTKHGKKVTLKAGQQTVIDTSSFHPGVYNLSMIQNGVIEASHEFVVAYPENHVFDMKNQDLIGAVNIWNDIDMTREYNKHYSVVAACGMGGWAKLQPEENRYDFESLERLLEFAAYTQKPIMYKVNHPAPDWIFNYVAHVGGKTPVDKNGHGGGMSRHERAKAPQFWSPAYKKYYKQFIFALADYVSMSPNGKWFLGLRVQPNAFNEEAWNYEFNGKEMPLAGITPDRSTWIAPKYGEIYPGLLEANNMKEGKQYFRDVITWFQDAFTPLGKYTFLRPYLEVDYKLDLDLSKVYQNKLTVCMGTDCTGSRSKILGKRVPVFKKYTYDLRKPAYHEDTWGSQKAVAWNQRHGRMPNYKFEPRTPEQDIYWRQIVKLYEGVTFGAFGAVEFQQLPNPAYQAAIDIFCKYSGEHFEPSRSTAAWTVLTGFVDWELNIKHRNVGYYLTEDNTSKTNIAFNCDENDHRGFMMAEIANEETSFSIADEFLTEHKNKKAKVSVEWLGNPGDKWEVLAVSGGEEKSLGEISAGSKREYRVDAVDLSELNFAKGTEGHIVLRKLSGKPLFHLIEVRPL